MNGLNVLFRSASKVMVLRALHHAEEPLSGREVERRTGLSNRATMVALDDLEVAGAVEMEVSGSSHMYSLNDSHYLVKKAVRPAFEAEDLFWSDFARTVQRTVRPRPIAAVATGPLAREETEYGGRVTLTMLFSSGRERVRSFRSITRLAERIRERHSLTLEYQLLDLNTMDQEEYDPLWRRVEREGILLFGELP